MDLDKARELLQSLQPEAYFKFMKEVHFDYPFKTNALTEKIIKNWRNDRSMKVDQFNEIIKEREVEHNREVREKLQADLKRIQDQSSRTGLDPLQLFPKEIWLMILDELRPEDKRSIREVHETFCDLTDDELIGEICLPLILGFKVERFWGVGAKINAHLGLPNPQSLLAKNAELRLVSKSLRNAIDRWYEDDLVSVLRNGDKKASPSGVFQANLLCPRDLKKVRKMESELSSSNCPKHLRFFTRSLDLISPEESSPHTDLGPEQYANYSQIIDTILDYVGDQIWYFSFEFHRPCKQRIRNLWDLRNRYISLLGWLSRMPNLKWLKLSFDQTERACKKDEFQIPEGASPPTLCHLERLDLELKKPNEYLMSICNGFLSANSRVKVLSLVGFDGYFDDEDDAGKVVVHSLRAPLSSLEVLSVEVPSSDSDFYTENASDDDDDDEEGDEATMRLDLLYAISSVNCQLRQIDLRLNTQNLHSLFLSLNNFKSLEKVVLSIGNAVVMDDLPFLRLPQLTHLKLIFGYQDDSFHVRGNCTFFFSLQFLLYAKKLNTLIWACSMRESEWDKVQRNIENYQPVGEMIDFGGGMKDISGSKSNIWRVFPWLKNVEVSRYVYCPGIMHRFTKQYRRYEESISSPSSSPSSNSSCA